MKNWFQASPRSGEIKNRRFITPILFLPGRDNCQLPTVNCQLSTVNCQLPTVNCQLSTVNCHLTRAWLVATKIVDSSSGSGDESRRVNLKSKID
ncbi:MULTISPECIES: hypothetical protein [unclassified Microcoleus]|uniref:hypothetical protein n=1 Tax=unclassified Microcoleus TaxID=2642155 RepID=UPI0025FA9077|nr:MULTISPECIES: hypothetical protein [unclassified Microcoleus]